MGVSSDQETFQTRAAELVSWVLPHDEEQSPLPDDPTPGMLVAWVTERLAQAGFELDQYRNQQRSGNQDASLYGIGVHFLGAATHAISAIAYVHPDGEEIEPLEFKAAMLRKLDEDVEQALKGDGYANATEDEWLRISLALLVGAYQGTCALEGLPRLAGRAGPERNARDQSEEDFGDDFGCDFEQTNLVYEEDFGFYLEGDESEGLDPDDEVDSNEDDLRAEIADSFLAAAVMAATAAQWFIERQEREKPPDQLDFRPFTRS